MPFRRSRDGDICPLFNEKIHSSGGKYSNKVLPCCASTKFTETGICEYHSQSWSGRMNATVQCKLKDEETSRDETKKRND